MTDNGGTVGVRVFNAGMRGQKGTPWSGGTRAASFWRWPGTLKPARVDALTAHIDALPTLAELAGANLNDRATAQIEGRSLVPLLENPAAPWPDRTLFTHLGRWPKGASPATGKYSQCSVRTAAWHLVCDSKANEKRWQLFDRHADPGESTDLAAQNPEVVTRLDAAYHRWWDSVQPQLINEDAKTPVMNAFKKLYEEQFGGGARQ
jgi:arylsulfatase